MKSGIAQPQTTPQINLNSFNRIRKKGTKILRVHPSVGKLNLVSFIETHQKDGEILRVKKSMSNIKANKFTHLLKTSENLE